MSWLVPGGDVPHDKVEIRLESKDAKSNDDPDDDLDPDDDPDDDLDDDPDSDPDDDKRRETEESSVMMGDSFSVGLCATSYSNAPHGDPCS